MALETTLSGFADRMVQLLTDNREDLGIAEKGIFYGDQNRIPVSPAVCVETDEKAVALKAVGRMTDLRITLYVIVYHSEIRDTSANRRDADKLAEAICDLINTNSTFFGLAIHCFVSDVTSGYATKQNTTMRASRILWEARSQERLPNS